MFEKNITYEIYEQYFEAELKYSGRKRNTALVKLIAVLNQQSIIYEVTATFLTQYPQDEFEASYDASFFRILYEGEGKRSKPKDEKYLNALRKNVDEMAAEAGGKVFWDKPLSEAKHG